MSDLPSDAARPSFFNDDVSPDPPGHDGKGPGSFDDDDGRPVGHSILAWILVVLVAAFVYYQQTMMSQAAVARGLVRQGLGTAGAAPAESVGALALQTLEVQGKCLLGAVAMGGSREDTYRQLKEGIKFAPIDFRLRYVVLAGELAGPGEALSQLKELRRLIEQHNKSPSSTQQRLLELLETLYQHYQGLGEAELEDIEKPWTEEDGEFLKSELGWYGLLALGPRLGEADEEKEPSAERREAQSSAQRALSVVLVGFLVGLLVLGAGAVGAIIFLVLILRRKLPSRLATGSRFGGVYAETFAIWMLLFVLLGVGSSFIQIKIDRLLLSSIVSGSSLIALAWPLVRGVSASQMASDFGITQEGVRAWVEPFWGLLAYVCTIPLMIFGLLVAGLLFSLSGGGGQEVDELSMPNTPSHPIAEMMTEGDAMAWLKIFFVAAIVAPIVEEIMFRGVLYRHLREWSRKWTIGASVLLSGAVSSFVFAIIHPQGLFGVPVLMSLALGFCLVREWRGSLIAPIVMHALNNGTVTTVILVLVAL